MSSWYPTPNKPFVGNFAKRQAELLSKKYNVTVLHTFSSEIDKTKVCIKKNELTEIFVEYPKGETPWTKWSRQKKAFFKGIEKIEKKIDLVFSEIILPKGRQFYLAKKHFNCDWIHLEIGSFIRKDWNFYEKWIVKPVKKNANLITVPSDFILPTVEKKLGKKPIQIPCHVDTKLFSFKEKKQNSTTKFLHISTLDEATKNPKGIFNSFSIALKKNPDLQLKIVCDESVEKWMALCKKLKISDNVSFEGPKKWNEVPNFYHNSDAFILNSEYETFSIVLIEAWATGTPTLTTSVGIGNKINPILGKNHPINSDEALAKNILDFAKNKHQFNGKEISKYAQKFSEENVLSEFIQLIEKTIG